MIKKSKVIYAAQTDPVDSATAKDQLYITDDNRDTVISRLITTSIELCQNYSGLSFITQTRRLKLDAFPSCSPYHIYLPFGPVIAISGSDSATPTNTLGVSYTNDDGGTTSLVLNTDFYLDSHSDIPRLAPVDDWPTDVEDDMIHPITITYTAGYGSAADVPSVIKDAILVQVAYMHEHPDGGELCEAAMNLLDTVKVYHNAWED